MRLLFFVLSVPLALAHRPKKPCLTPTTAQDLMDRWFAAWTAVDVTAVPALAANVVSSDFTYTDETLNFGVGPCVAPPEGPIVSNLEGFIGLLSITISESVIEDEAFTVLDTVIECEKLAFRWQGAGKAIGSVIPNITAHPGDPVRWKGIDIIHVDLSDPTHPLAKSSQSSGDWFWFQYYAGVKTVFQKYNFPACLCQDAVPDLDSNGQCVSPPTGGLPPLVRM